MACPASKDILILDDPTIDVDIEAKSEIVETIRSMANEGMGILVISSELEELLAVSDRIVVLYNGTITKEIYHKDIETEEALHHARVFEWCNYIVYIAFVLILIFFGITLGGQGFLLPSNLLNIVRETTMITIMATAMTFVIASGEIDLSIGSTSALAALLSALAMQAGLFL